MFVWFFLSAEFPRQRYSCSVHKLSWLNWYRLSIWLGRSAIILEAAERSNIQFGMKIFHELSYRHRNSSISFSNSSLHENYIFNSTAHTKSFFIASLTSVMPSFLKYPFGNLCIDSNLFSIYFFVPQNNSIWSNNHQYINYRFTYLGFSIFSFFLSVQPKLNKGALEKWMMCGEAMKIILFGYLDVLLILMWRVCR